MKKLSAALLTFTIGVLAFILLGTQTKEEFTDLNTTQSVIKVSKTPVVLISYENVPTKKDRVRRPFFDSFDKDKDDEFFSGWLIPDKFKGMPEVWTILFHGDGGRDENSKDKKSHWSAMVLTNMPDGESNDDDNFHSVEIKTEGNHLSFKTNKIRGIEYQFDGEFLRNGTDFEQEEKVLRGTMQKIVKGKQTAKFTADFGYYEPHCFH